MPSPTTITTAISQYPATFECTSGELVYGQVHCALEGLAQTSKRDGISTSTPLAQGGTIQQNAFHYRAAARKGKWSVSRIYTQTDSDEKSRRHLGYIAHHEGVSPDDYLRRVSKVGISNGNRHADQQIVYVGRYDWSWTHGSRAAINRIFGLERPYTTTEIEELRGGRLVVADASKKGDFVDLLKSSLPPRQSLSLSPSSDPAQSFGVHLDGAGSPRVEYELGWLAFSGQKHPDFPEDDELVALVYDPVYDGFQDLSTERDLLVEDKVVAHEQPSNQVDQADTEDSDEEYVPDEDDAEDDEDDEDEDEDEEDEESDLEAGELDALGFATADQDLQSSSVPPPTISSVNIKASGRVEILGSTLRTTRAVTVGGQNVAFSVLSNDKVTATIPLGLAGETEVQVTSPSGSAASTVVVPPLLAAVDFSPDRTTIWGGSVITLKGFHLDKLAHVVFSAGTEEVPALDIQIVSSTEARVTVPAGPVSRLNPAFGEQPDLVYATVKVKPSDASEDAIQTTKLFVYDPTLSPNDGDDYGFAIKTWAGVLNTAGDGTLKQTARENLSYVYTTKGAFDDLISLWREEVSLVQQNAEVTPASTSLLHPLRSLGRAYLAAGRFQEAVETFEKAFLEGDDEGTAYDGFVGALEGLGDKARATKLKEEKARVLAQE